MIRVSRMSRLYSDEMTSRKNTILEDSPSWINVADVNLKITKCYEDTPSLNIKNAIHFAACGYGGPVAIAYSNSTTSWFVQIRTSSGFILGDNIEIPDVFAMEWSRGFRLVVVDRRGRATLFSPLGERTSEFYFSTNVRELREWRVFPTWHDSGAAVMDDQHRLLVVNSVEEPVAWSINCPSKDRPSAWTVAQPMSQLTRVIMILNIQFYTGDQGEQLTLAETFWAQSDGAYGRIAVCGDHSSVAVYHSSRLIQIVSWDLSHESHRIHVGGELSTYRFGWVGSEALFLQTTPTHMIFFSAAHKEARYEYPTEFVQIVLECDGIRLFGDRRNQFISVVKEDERAVLGVASSEDGALLNEAAQYLEGIRSQIAYDYITQIRDMPKAIKQCVSTAKENFSTEQQKGLLKAARLGMAFDTATDSSEFVRTVRLLRVLNELRSPRIGIPLSYTQLEELTEQCVLNRLIDMGQYGEAIALFEWIGGREQADGVDRALLHWVRRLITSAASKAVASDAQLELLEQKIADKLSIYPHVSIADAAKKAIDSKLPKLARLLIKRETDDSKQVAVLLQLGDVQEALARAAAAQSPQLMHLVVRHLMATHKRAEYELAIRKIPMAQCLYQDMVKNDASRKGQQSMQMLALLEQASDFERQTLFHLDTAENEMNATERLNSLRRAKDTAHSLGDKNIEEVIGDMAAFAPSQSERNQDHLTIRETVIRYATDGQKVAQIKNQAKLSDKQVWFWTIEGLAKAGKMEMLFDLAQKKSPVGYVPFIEACMRYHRGPDECRKYLPKVNGYQDLVAAHLAMGNYVGAAKLAFDRRDGDTLLKIRIKAHHNKEALSKVMQFVKAMD